MHPSHPVTNKQPPQRFKKMPYSANFLMANSRNFYEKVPNLILETNGYRWKHHAPRILSLNNCWAAKLHGNLQRIH
jgi:hypothetical protein